MSYSSLIGNEPAIARLRGVVACNRAAHAYLLAGPSGVGKRTAALAFAGALLCPRVSDGAGCGTCDDCRRVVAGRHPNLRLLAHAADKREILIEQVRELQRELSFRAAGAQPRIILVDEAERMNEEAQNAFLKTLEEPPDRCFILLVTASPALLLPTIASRCQTVLFMPLSEELMARFARERLTSDATGAGLIARLAAGSPGRATALSKDLADLKARALDLLASVAAGDLNTVIERLSKIRDTEQARDRAREQLTILAFALREILRARTFGTPPDPDLAPAGLLERLKLLEVEDLATRLSDVLDHLRMIDQNANVPLTVEDSLLRI